MGKVRHDALPQKVQNISENMWEQAETVLRMSNNGSKKTKKRYRDAEHRLCDFLAERYQTKNLKNLEARHIYAYATMLMETDHMPNYIRTEMAGIRYFHKRLGSKNILPTNKQLGIMPKDDYKFNRAFLPSEFKDMVQAAVSMKRYDVVIVSYLARYFGLRLEEAVTIRVFQLEEALRYKRLHITNGKGGQKRDIPVDIKIQESILERCLAYAKKNGKAGDDYLICDGHKNSVKRKMASLQNWRTNHGNKFIDPNRTELVEPGKKPRIKRPSWHGLRHLYFQENKRRLLGEDKLTKRQVENELSERMGHHRNEVKKFYSDDLEDS